jgi:peptidoglycan/xylan/chitin deacetylase (PgdA/CDA1 family)
MYLVRTPALLKPLARDLVWHMPRTERAVYLTFDDGPIPEVTPWVLDQLALFQAKGTFFCIGRNAATHPDILARIRQDGHAVGNHTWDHPNGWRTEQRNYLRNVLQCQAITGTRLFRPPYGRMTLGQSKALSTRFRIIMWEVLSADFDTTLSGDDCVRNTLRHVQPGSIIVFHDSLKAEPRLRHALPLLLGSLSQDGYAFKALAETGW